MLGQELLPNSNTHSTGPSGPREQHALGAVLLPQCCRARCTSRCSLAAFRATGPHFTQRALTMTPAARQVDALAPASFAPKARRRKPPLRENCRARSSLKKEPDCPSTPCRVRFPVRVPSSIGTPRGDWSFSPLRPTAARSSRGPADCTLEDSLHEAVAQKTTILRRRHWGGMNQVAARHDRYALGQRGAAAEFLGLPPRSLRRTLERESGRAADGGVEALVDGVRGRKFGRLWRVQFNESWLSTRAPHEPHPPSSCYLPLLSRVLGDAGKEAGMTVHKYARHGKPRWVIEIPYRHRLTRKRVRFRKDADVQTSAAAHAEERRLIAEYEHGFIRTTPRRRRRPHGATHAR